VKKLFTSLIFLFIQLTLFAQVDTVAYQQLEETVVSAYKNSNIIKGNFAEGLHTSAIQLEKFPKLFGQVDPVVFAQSLPGVQTNAILSYGMNIQGCNDSHNNYTVADMPYLLPPRLLGLFPVVNTDHFTDIELSKNPKGNKLGGYLSFDVADTIPSKININASLGLISAQASISAPINDKISFIASARASFLTAIYNNIVSINAGSLNTDFRDYNATLLWIPDSMNTIDFNIINSNDFYTINYGDYGYYFDIKTPQVVGGLRWRHNGNIKFNNRIYYLNKQSDIQLSQESISSKLASYIKEIGWNWDFNLPLGINIYNQFKYYDILPQKPSIDYVYELNLTQQKKQTAIEASSRIEKSFELSNLTFNPSITFNHYKQLGYSENYFNIDPELYVKWNLYHNGYFVFNIGRKHQYLSQTSMLPSSVPASFWFASGEIIPPQESLFADVTYQKDFFNGKWSLTNQIYYKHLTNQVEYYGFLFNLMTSDYHLEDNLINTEGNNYGANIMISKNAGDFTGWIAYSYGRALRTTVDDTFTTIFPASHERPHEFNLVISYHFKQFDFGANFVLASGTPYTRIKSLYLIQDAVLADFDDFNGARLASYHKLDITATYNFKTKGDFEHGINLSIYNATCKNNQIGYRVKMLEDNTILYGPAKLFFNILPTINYFIKL